MTKQKQKQKHQSQGPAGLPYRLPSAARPIGSLLTQPEKEFLSAHTRDVLELTERNFASSIDGHPFAVVVFWVPSIASSCAFTQTLAAAAPRNPDVLFAKVNAEDQQAIAVQFDIRSIPTTMIFRNNIIVHVKAGTLQAGALDELLRAVRALEMEQVQRNVVSVDRIALGGTVAPTLDAELPAPVGADPLSIEAHLRPSLRGPGSALTQIAGRLAAGDLIAIRDAFDPEFAEKMYRCLDRCTNWRVYEGYEGDFHYHHHNLYRSEEYPADLASCSAVFDSSSTKAWVAQLSGRSCVGPTEFSASWYLPGDHSLPHNDVADSGPDSVRQVAFVWHLAKDWQSEWGGALFWCAKGSYVPPAFNTLFLFNVTPRSTHFVTHVSPYAQGKRLAINGWWTGPTMTGAAVWNGPDRISTDGTEILIY